MFVLFCTVVNFALFLKSPAMKLAGFLLSLPSSFPTLLFKNLQVGCIKVTALQILMQRRV